MGGDRIEVGVAQLGLAKERHDACAVADVVFDDLRRQVGAVLEHGGLETAVFLVRLSPEGRVGVPLQVRLGARGRSRTDTLLRAADFRPTPAFAVPRIALGCVVWSTPSP